MRPPLTVLAIVTVLAAVLANAQDAPRRTSLRRELVIFAPTVRDPRFNQQITLLRSSLHDLRERDVQVLLAIEKASVTDLRPFSSNDLFILLNGPQRARQRRNFRIDPASFTVILIGKDGGEKLRRHTPLPVATLNSVIDAMPMRREEMRTRPR